MMKIFILQKNFILIISLLILSLQIPNLAYAGEFKVYSPRAYRELEKVRAPIEIKSNSPMKTQLLVDYSGSMRNWIKIAIDTLEYVLPTLARRHSMGLRTFGGRGPAKSRCNNTCQASEVIASFNRSNDQTIISGLKNSQIGGNTPIEFALRKTVDEDFDPATAFDRHDEAIKTKKIILVTDGYDTCGGDPCAYIRELMATRKDIMIDVIQLGSSNKLACLADETGGKFYTVNQDLESFEIAFEESLDLPSGIIEMSKTDETSTYKEKTPHYSPRKPMGKHYKFVNYE